MKEIIEKLDRIEAILAKQDKPLTLQEAATYLDYSPSYLYKLTSSGQIPHYKPNGKRIYFLRSDLNAFLLQNRIKSVEEIEEMAVRRVAQS